jgi:hypothetical protein
MAQEAPADGQDVVPFATTAKISSVTPKTNRETATTSVTIVGTGLTATSTVTIGSVASGSKTVTITDSTGVPTKLIGTVPLLGASDKTLAGTAQKVNLGGTAQSATFTWTEPTISAVSPTKGPRAGTTAVTVKGKVLNDVSTVKFGSSSGSSVHAASDGLSLTVTAPAGTGSGSVDVTASDGVNTASKTGGFTYVGPAISAVTPAKGAEAGTTAITIKGTNLQFVSHVKVNGSSASSVVAAADGKSVTATAPAGTGAGKVDVSVDDGLGAVTKTGAFTYVAPTISAVTPAKGAEAGTTAITIKGTNLQFVSHVKVNGSNASSVSAAADGKSVTATAPAGTGAGKVDVSVNDGISTTTKTGAFTYVAPTISAVTPSSAYAAATQTITIKGTGLSAVSGVKVNGNAASSVTPVSGGLSLTAVAPKGTSAAKVDVAITDGISTVTKTAAYTYNAPTISAVTPANVSHSGTPTMTITGKGLTWVDKVLVGTATISVSEPHASDTSITFPYNGSQAAGAQNIKVEYSSTELGGGSGVDSAAKSYTFK